MVSHRDQYLVPRFSYFTLMTYQKQLSDNAEIILFAYDTSIIITGLNPMNFESNVNTIFQDINRWFTTNLLLLNVDKAQFMQFITKTISLHFIYTKLYSL
jgi:hypothetical protein